MISSSPSRMMHGCRGKCQKVFGGVERGSGKLFLVAVHNRTKETLLALIKEWIRPRRTVDSDCWKSYDCLAEENYVHLTVNHSYCFVDLVTQWHTNTIESVWRHIKASLPVYNRQTDFCFYLAEFMFRASCQEKKVDVFTTFLELVRKRDWTDFTYGR
ncbi:DDE_Tnp_IS1595 domain-containing protein [Trichonephila clavipes]|nr:DDE_Tnp_IS1595 domain-containing protein [Trichonephila clavipes]